jgi:hypothetical protein
MPEAVLLNHLRLKEMVSATKGRRVDFAPLRAKYAIGMRLALQKVADRPTILNWVLYLPVRSKSCLPQFEPAEIGPNNMTETDQA